ncbi:MAG: hypothetical protein OQL08_01440 [Gammaproteobacteria bacterium]|nr:hypothetical protein [Gammaproteobacteria bacterium]
MSEIQTISPELTPEQCLAFAQFLKRVSFSDYYENAVDKDEAYTMMAAGEEIRAALREVGYAPR